MALSHVETGAGAPVILIHGMYASNYDWSSLLPALDEAGYHAFAPDLFGHGESPRPTEPGLYTCHTIYQSLDAWLDSLPIEPPYTLVGHSLGGYLSLRYGLQHPDKTRALVLINPLYSRKQLTLLPALSRRRPAVAARALQWVTPQMIQLAMGWDPMSARFSPQTRLRIAMDYKRASPYILHILRTVLDLSDDLPNLAIPSLVIWGDRDMTLKPGSFPRLIQALPNGSGRRVPKAGHQPHVGEPDIVNPVVIDFISHQNGKSAA